MTRAWSLKNNYDPNDAGCDQFGLQARQMLAQRDAYHRCQMERHFGLTQQEMVDFLIEMLPISQPGECLAEFGDGKGTPVERYNALAAYLNAGCGSVPSSIGADA